MLFESISYWNLLKSQKGFEHGLLTSCSLWSSTVLEKTLSASCSSKSEFLNLLVFSSQVIPERLCVHTSCPKWSGLHSVELFEANTNAFWYMENIEMWACTNGQARQSASLCVPILLPRIEILRTLHCVYAEISLEHRWTFLRGGDLWGRSKSLTPLLSGSIPWFPITGNLGLVV